MFSKIKSSNVHKACTFWFGISSVTKIIITVDESDKKRTEAAVISLAILSWQRDSVNWRPITVIYCKEHGS